jgi:hypothetical protein
VVCPQLLQNVSINKRFCDLQDEDHVGWVKSRLVFLRWLRRRVVPSVRHLKLQLDRLDEVGTSMISSRPARVSMTNSSMRAAQRGTSCRLTSRWISYSHHTMRVVWAEQFDQPGPESITIV